MVEILSFGRIKFLLGKLIEKICNKYCLDTLYKNDPELVYYEREKKMAHYTDINMSGCDTDTFGGFC